MLRPVIDDSLCQGCTPCQSRAACKMWAFLQIDPGETPVIDLGRCSGCGHCFLACTFQAVSMRSENTIAAISSVHLGAH